MKSITVAVQSFTALLLGTALAGCVGANGSFPTGNDGQPPRDIHPTVSPLYYASNVATAEPPNVVTIPFAPVNPSDPSTTGPHQINIGLPAGDSRSILLRDIHLYRTCEQLIQVVVFTNMGVPTAVRPDTTEDANTTSHIAGIGAALDGGDPKEVQPSVVPMTQTTGPHQTNIVTSGGQAINLEKITVYPVDAQHVIVRVYIKGQTSQRARHAAKQH